MSVLERLGIDSNVIEQLVQKPQSKNQEQTKKAFAFEWSNPCTHMSKVSTDARRTWAIERYCDGNVSRLQDWLPGDGKIILDVGCGTAYATIAFFGDLLKSHDYLGVDISDAVETARSNFKEAGYDGDFLQANIVDIPIPDESIDLIFAEGVLQYTDDTERTLAHLATKIRSGGRILFYVYARKGAIREYTDDYIRSQLQMMTDPEAWDELKSLTKLGIALGELNVTLNVPEDIPFLGISAGEVDIQRFFYWNVCKAFYRSDFSFDEMHHVNFDWFRPLNCHRHTKEDIVSYCEHSNLVIDHLNVQESGITVVAKKN